MKNTHNAVYFDCIPHTLACCCKYSLKHKKWINHHWKHKTIVSSSFREQSLFSWEQIETICEVFLRHIHPAWTSAAAKITSPSSGSFGVATKTTASIQLPRTFKGNNCLYQQVGVVWTPRNYKEISIHIRLSPSYCLQLHAPPWYFAMILKAEQPIRAVSLKNVVRHRFNTLNQLKRPLKGTQQCRTHCNN